MVCWFFHSQGADPAFALRLCITIPQNGGDGDNNATGGGSDDGRTARMSQWDCDNDDDDNIIDD